MSAAADPTRAPGSCVLAAGAINGWLHQGPHTACTAVEDEAEHYCKAIALRQRQAFNLLSQRR